jgi:aldehyde dehydrogenase (NAD+)
VDDFREDHPTGRSSIESAEAIVVIDATSEEVYGSVPAGTPSQVDKAVRAARDAFAGWSQTPPDKHAKYLEA